MRQHKNKIDRILIWFKILQLYCLRSLVVTKIRSDIFYNTVKKKWLIYCVSIYVPINICVFVNIITMCIGQGWIIDYIGLWWRLKNISPFNGTARKPLIFTSQDTVTKDLGVLDLLKNDHSLGWMRVCNKDLLAAPIDECANKLNSKMSIAFHIFNSCFSNNIPLWCINIKSNWAKFSWLFIGNLPFWKGKILFNLCFYILRSQHIRLAR